MPEVSNHKNLVIIAAGSNSLHVPWLRDTNRKFDIFTVDYSSQRLLQNHEANGTYYMAKTGFKPQLVALAIDRIGEKIKRYDRIWLPDDDLYIRACDVNRMFDLAKKYKLDIGQPALTANSYFTHRITLKIPLLECHFTNFVEVMAPFFKTKLLLQYSEILKESKTGWGLDFLWQKHCLERSYKMGVIDKTPVVHTRPVNAIKKGGSCNQSIYAKAGDPSLEFKNFCQANSVKEKKPLSITSARLKGGIPIPVFIARLMTSRAKRYRDILS